MKLGYARTSHSDQIHSLDAQIEELKRLGCERIYSEQISSIGERPEFNAVIDYAREGDVIIISKLDRGFRDCRQALEVAESLRKKGVGLRLMDLDGVDVNSSPGRLVFTMMSSFAEFEHTRMKERQAIGIAKRREKLGKKAYPGRKSTICRKTVKALADEGKKYSEIATDMGVCRSSIYRILKN